MSHPRRPSLRPLRAAQVASFAAHLRTTDPGSRWLEVLGRVDPGGGYTRAMAAVMDDNNDEGDGEEEEGEEKWPRSWEVGGHFGSFVNGAYGRWVGEWRGGGGGAVAVEGVGGGEDEGEDGEEVVLGGQAGRQGQEDVGLEREVLDNREGPQEQELRQPVVEVRAGAAPGGERHAYPERGAHEQPVVDAYGAVGQQLRRLRGVVGVSLWLLPGADSDEVVVYAVTRGCLLELVCFAVVAVVLVGWLWLG